MLQLSIGSALAAAVAFVVALYELTNIWWALLVCSLLLAAVSFVAGFAADMHEPSREREAH